MSAWVYEVFFVEGLFVFYLYLSAFCYYALFYLSFIFLCLEHSGPLPAHPSQSGEGENEACYAASAGEVL